MRVDSIAIRQHQRQLDGAPVTGKHASELSFGLPPVRHEIDQRDPGAAALPPPRGSLMREDWDVARMDMASAPVISGSPAICAPARRMRPPEPLTPAGMTPACFDGERKQELTLIPPLLVDDAVGSCRFQFDVGGRLLYAQRSPG